MRVSEGQGSNTVSVSAIVLGLILFNVGFIVGAFWVSAKESDDREYGRQDFPLRREPG
jgi:hypothetical protein